MRIVYPEGTESLLDTCKRYGVENVWRKLASGHLLAFQWRLSTGEFFTIPPQEWTRPHKVIEKGGCVVQLHPVELMESGDLSWIGAQEVGGVRIKDGIGDDPVLIESDHARALFPRTKLEADKGGRPEHPARAWYAERGFSRQGLTMKQLQREMESATGAAPPGQSTIREWEKNAQKPPTEN